MKTTQATVQDYQAQLTDELQNLQKMRTRLSFHKWFEAISRRKLRRVDRHTLDLLQRTVDTVHEHRDYLARGFDAAEFEQLVQLVQSLHAFLVQMNAMADEMKHRLRILTAQALIEVRIARTYLATASVRQRHLRPHAQKLSSHFGRPARRRARARPRPIPSRKPN